MSSSSISLEGSPMEGYVALMSSSSDDSVSSASVRAVIHKILTHPQIFAGFAEFAALPTVRRALRVGANSSNDNDDDEQTLDPALRTLELFAYGNYKDYQQSEESNDGLYLKLTDVQLLKLRQLTVSTVVRSCGEKARIKNQTKLGGVPRRSGGRSATTSNTFGISVSYSLLRSELGLPPDGPLRDLEDVLTSCIYSGVVNGRLDQRRMRLVVVPGNSSAAAATHSISQPHASRDVKVEDIPKMIASLQSFHDRGQHAIDALDKAMSTMERQRIDNADYWNTVDTKVAQAKQKASTRTRPGVSSSSAIPDVAGQWLGMDPASAVDLTMEGIGGRGAIAAGRRQTKRSRGGMGGDHQFTRY